MDVAQKTKLRNKTPKNGMKTPNKNKRSQDVEIWGAETEKKNYVYYIENVFAEMERTFPIFFSLTHR